MYDERTRRSALAALAAGASVNAVARATSINRSTLRAWREAGDAGIAECFRCEDLNPARGGAYAALLGFYLGDGCISTYRNKHFLRVSCDQTLPGIVSDVTAVIQAIHPTGGVFHVSGPGVTVVQSNWKHWPCLFPQHGPGRKHERTIALQPWQREVVEALGRASSR